MGTLNTGRYRTMWGRRLWITISWGGYCHKPSKTYVTRTFRLREGLRLTQGVSLTHGTHHGDLSKRPRTLRN